MSDAPKGFPFPPGSGRKLILGLATFTLVGFSLIGILIIEFSSEIHPIDLIKGHSPFWTQLLSGTAMGLVASLLAHWIISRNWMKKVHEKYAGLIGPLKLNIADVIYISICAGVGEEILFRGAIQPLIGIIFTAVGFVALHGYLNPKDARISAYGFFMVMVMIAIGYMCDIIGIGSSIIAHTIIDIYLLLVLSRSYKAEDHDTDHNNAA